MKAVRRTGWLVVWSLFLSMLSIADPYPPTWNNGNGAAIHYTPVAWPSEPVNPVNCGTTCGDWKPYTRFQQNMNDPRTQDPSNGGTSPQSYVNVTSSCSDKSLPSIYFHLRQGATPADDVLMFRWRVESAPQNYATGPSAGSFGASNPWSSALWTVLFDINGSGYRSLAAHLDGSIGSPAAPIDRLVGIWSNTTSQSLDYLSDPNVHALGHNPTAFIGPTGKVMNFHNTLNPNETWANGSAETVWDYGTTRARTVTQNSCTEYFVDYQIPIALLDASGIGGPKITRTTPISMLFCTANSLNNPFQKDCAINKGWTADTVKPAPFGDYLSFNQTDPYSQPIISSVTATAPNSCPGTYTLKATVQDTLALQSGVVVPSVQQVDFYYWYDKDGNGLADDIGSAWTKISPTATLDTGTLNKWTASWDASALSKGKYLIGTQALDDNTKLDDGMTSTGINNRTFSYLSGDAANKVYIGGAWISGQQSAFPSHTPTQTPSSGENWYGNPDVTGQQIALVGTAINACGLAPTISLSGSAANLIAGGSLTYTITLTNPVANSSAITISQVTGTLPSGFSYQNNTTIGTGGLGSSNPSVAGQVLTWTYGSPVSLAPGASATLTYGVAATSTAGNYNATAASVTSFGTIQSSPVAVAVDAARVSLAITPSATSIAANGSTQLTFTLNYSNDSTVSLSGATLTGSLPSGATYVSCSGGSACGNSSGSLSWTLGTLAGGASGSATLVMTIPNTWSTSSLTQSATLTATAPDASTVTKTATRTVAVTGYSSTTSAGFTLTKTASVTQVAPGGSITYTIAYNNYGGTAATSVVITDTLPSGLTYVSSTGSGVNSSGTVTWNIGTVAAGASSSVTVTATAGNPFTATNPTSNSAAINWSGGSTVTSAAVAVGVTGQSCSTYYFRSTTGTVGFDGTKKLATTSPVPVSGDTGSSVTVTAPISGSAFLEALRFYQDPATSSDVPFDGNITTNMYIDRANGQGLNIRTTVYDYNSSTGATTQLAQSTQLFNGSTKGLLSFSVTPSGTLAKNHRLLWVYEVRSNHASQTVQVQLQYAGTVTNAISGGTTFANSNAQYCITPPANLSTQVTVDQSSITAGTTPTLKYTIKYTNTGSASATNTSLVDTLPSGFTTCEYSLNNSTWASCSGGSAHTFSLGTVTAGSSGTVYVRGVVPSGTTGGEIYTDSVSLSSDQTSAVTASAVSQVATPGSSLGASLAMSLTSNVTTAQPGDAVVYSLSVTNVGDTSATSVVVSNALPLASYFTYGSCTGGCVNTTGTLSWALGTLAAGASQTYTYTMNVGSSGLGSGITVITDDASAAGSPSLSATSNSVSLSLNGNPELSGSMTATPNSGLAPGDTVTYSISLQNTGNASATSVVVADPIPSNTSFKGTITATAGSGSFDTVNNRVLFDVGTLAAGASVTLSYQVTVNGLASGNTTLSNTATASGSNAAAINISTNAAASAAASLDLTQVAVGAGMYPAATLTANASGTTIYVDRTDAFQIGQYVKVGNSVGHILSLAAQSITLDVPVTVNSGDTVVGAITLNLSYSNLGNAPATTVSLTDTLPTGLGYYTSSPLASSAPVIGASGAVTWSIGTLDVGASGTRTIVVFPTGTTGSLTSQGVLSATNASNATANASVSIGGISATKSTSTPLLAASGTASYSITLTNSLGAPATSVTVSDSLADGFTYHTNSATVGDTPTEPTFSGSDTAHQQPQWTGLTVPANGSLVITLQADAASSAGAGVYQNEVVVSAGAGVGILQYDALSNTNEDVTLLGANTGVLNGTVFYRNSGSSSSFVPGTDLPLAGVRVEIYKLGADCTDPYSATCYVVFTDSNGYFQKVLAAEGWYVKAVSNTGELSSSWDQVVGANATQVTVPDQGSVSDQNGFKLTSGYLVSASAGTGGSISPTSATVASGNTTTFTVTPDTGYTIASVSGTCGGNLSSSTYTTNAITAACTVVASFNLTTYAVTFDLAGGTRTGGGALSQTVAYNTAATAPTFTAPTGKTFTGWSTTFSSVTGPLTVTALYTDTIYMVTASAGTGGSISPSVGYTVVHGNTASFTLTPSTGYDIAAVTGTCGGGLTGNVYTSSAVTADCAMQANFTLSTFAVVFDLAGGTRTGGGALSQSVAYNAAATAPVFTPPTGKTFTGWSTSFSSITAPLTVTALYTDSIYTVTPSAGAGGTISPATGQSITHGNTTSFTLTPTTGYIIGSVTGSCGGSLSASTYTTNVVTANCTVSASFVAASYTITFDLDGGARTGGGALVQSVTHGSSATAPSLTPPTGKVFASWSNSFSSITGPLTITAVYTDASYNVSPNAGVGGSISPASVQVVQYGNTTSFTASPNTGYSLASVTGCSGNLSGNTFTTGIITSDCSVQANFTINQYTVVFDLAGGSRTGGGALSQSVPYGSPATAPVFTSPTGKTFSGWSTSFSSITGSLTVTALYGDLTHSVTPSAGTGGSISPAVVQSIIHGQTTSFVATPNTGYSLTSVSGSCGGTLTGNNYVTNAVTSDCTVQANFTIDQYTVIFDLAGGSRTGGGALSQSVAYGGSATAPVFTSPSGKTFSGWSTTFTSITGALNVSALYGDLTHTVTPSAGAGGSISPAVAQLIIHGQTTSFVATPDTGYTLASVSGSCSGSLSGNTYTTSTITSDCMVQANFTISQYTVVFDLAGGSRTGGGALSQSVSYGSLATAPVFTSPSGKIFSGWSTTFSSITGSLTVTALYGDLTHSVTPSAGTGGSISPAVIQSIIHGETTSFVVTPNTGYSLTSVSGSCGGNLTGNNYVTNAVTSDCTVQASFTINQYTVIFDLAGGSRTGGGALSQTVAYNGAATPPTFTPPTGETFSGWSTSFNVITGPLTVTALYGTTLHTVTPSANTGGSISPATVEMVASGGTASFTITPTSGYTISSIDGSCGGTLTGLVYTTATITADCSVIAYFTASTYAVTFDLDGGTRTGGGVLAQFVAHGAAATAPKMTPPTGKFFVGWSTSFTSITGPLTITALYATTAYTVTPSAGIGGAISPATLQTVGEGGVANFVITPSTGYAIATVTGTCGGVLNASTYATNPISSNCSVVANFVPATYTVVFDLAGGVRLGGGELNQVISHGADAIAPSLTPPTGKTFSQWSTLFTGITGSLTVVAIYSDATYIVTATVSTGGSVTPSNAQTVAYNATASFQLLPSNGYVFVSAGGDCVGGKVGDIYTTAAIISDCAINFTFNPLLKSVDEQGKSFTGEVLRSGSSRTFKVAGGSGKWQLRASARQAGVTASPTTESAIDFLAKTGATLVDLGNGNYRFTSSRSGQFTLTFTDEDGQSLTMVFTVYPNLGFTSTYQQSALGKTTQVKVLLDDDPIDYPVIAPYTVDGSLLANNLAAQAEFTIASGRLALIEFTPKVSAGEIDFLLTSKGLTNTALGDIAQHKVALKELGSIPMNVTLSAQQANETKTVMLNTGGVVTLLTSLTGSGYSYDWSASAPELGIGTATTWQPTFNPTGLSGPYLVKVTVKEVNAPGRTQTIELLLRIVASQPVAYTHFYDINYEVNPNRLPICTDGGMVRVNACRDVLKAVYMETLSTYEIKLGRSSDFASWRDLEFGLATESKDIRDSEGKSVSNQNDVEFLHLGYEVDFEISGLEQAGQTVPVVIPLKPGLTIPRSAVWRKYSTAGWRNFVENTENQIHSAKRAADRLCPSPSADAWVPGLNMGDDCVRLIIQDGGPNDLDSRADGVIRDPSALAVRPDFVEVTTVGKGRGGAIDLLLLLALTLIGFTCSRKKIILIKFKKGQKNA